MNRKDRRLVERIPEELSTVLKKVTANWKLLSYKPGGPGWSADIQIKGRAFRLNSEYGYIEVEELIDGSYRAVPLPSDQRERISPEQVACLINAMIA
jgi:hypothetical protein